MRLRRRLRSVGVAFSRLANAFWHGEEDVTFSAWSYEIERRGQGSWKRRRVDALPFMGTNHCRKSWEWHMAHGLITTPANKESHHDHPAFHPFSPCLSEDHSQESVAR